MTHEILAVYRMGESKPESAGMSRQPNRLPEGGSIDRTRPLRFRFDGRDYEGYAGDTLASALLANGVRVAGRSFKYHRPRGIMGAGVEEPNVLVQIEGSSPDLRATEVALTEGLVARPGERVPNARFDLAAVNGWVSRFLPAGFYYKTFLWPRWTLYESPIRRAAGLGVVPDAPAGMRYDTRHAHCDVLVVGGGVAGARGGAGRRGIGRTRDALRAGWPSGRPRPLRERAYRRQAARCVDRRHRGVPRDRSRPSRC